MFTVNKNIHNYPTRQASKLHVSGADNSNNSSDPDTSMKYVPKSKFRSI